MITDAVLQAEIDVTLSTQDDTAEANNDYSAVTSAVVTLTPSSTTQPVTVTALEDTLVELAETFSVSIDTVSSPPMSSFGWPDYSVVTINDNDGR